MISISKIKNQAYIYSPCSIRITGEDMLDRKLILLFASGFIGLIILLDVPFSMVFMALLLGALIAPPIFVFASVFIEGILVLARELKSIFASGREFLLISMSKEYIILEPEYIYR